jgi:hypothetical protein
MVLREGEALGKEVDGLGADVEGHVPGAHAVEVDHAALRRVEARRRHEVDREHEVDLAGAGPLDEVARRGELVDSTSERPMVACPAPRGRCWPSRRR